MQYQTVHKILRDLTQLQTVDHTDMLNLEWQT